MMHHTQAYASDDATLADWLASFLPTRTNEQGERETYDSASGLWRNDADLVMVMRHRQRRRDIMGSEDIARQMNREGL